MCKFSDIRDKLGLKKFCDNQLGTLYAVPFSPGIQRLMVRYFDRDLPRELVKPFASLIQTAGKWIEDRPELARLVKVEQSLEVGQDFISRPYHMYGTSIDAYVEWDNPPNPPKELEEMRNCFLAAIGKSLDPKDVIIEAILSRSLLEPTGKTYFDETKKQFIIVEPKLTREDVEQWASLTTSE